MHRRGLARGHMRHAVDAVMLFDNPFKVTGCIGMRLRQSQSLRAQFGAEPTVLNMAAQINELAHQQAPVIISAPGMARGALERVIRCPWHLHEFVGPLTEVEVADADPAVFALRSDATVGFAGFGRSGTH